MSSRTIDLSEELYQYLLAVSVREGEVQRRLREETAAMPMAMMQISPEQGQLMAMFVRLTGARSAIEVGVFTGYSALSVALALPDDGHLIACDVSEEWTSVGQRYWREANVDSKIDLRLGPALETLDGLIAEGRGGQFDLAFIDADKSNYAVYFERCLTLLRQGGLILVDNVLWSGAVIDDSNQSDDTNAIRAFNAARTDDQRVDISMLPIGDGLTLARKR